MNPYRLQALYRRLANPTLRRSAIRAVRGLGLRYLVLRVDTNDICNLRCPMCYLSDPDRQPVARPMSRDQFRHVADQLFGRARFLYLSCGTEPLATPHFDELLDITGRYKVPFTSYCSNGLLLRDRFIDATLRNRLSEVIFSVDGASKEVYEKIRVGGSWEKLNERMQALTDAVQRWQGPVPEIRFNFTAQEDNVSEMVDFASWAVQWRPATLQYRIFRPLEGARKQTDDARTVREFRQRLPEIRSLCARSGVHVETAEVPETGLAENVQAELSAGAVEGGDGADLQDTVAPAATAASPDARRNETNSALALAGAEAEKPRSVNCQLPWFTMYVRADGQVTPCAVHGPVGNIFRQSLAEIDAGEQMTELRQSLRRRPKDICIECQRSGASGISL